MKCLIELFGDELFVFVHFLNGTSTVCICLYYQMFGKMFGIFCLFVHLFFGVFFLNVLAIAEHIGFLGAMLSCLQALQALRQILGRLEVFILGISFEVIKQRWKKSTLIINVHWKILGRKELEVLGY